ncbi:CDP-alcohol phosphatidyltransferase family protein [Mucilaginibacter galii]|nr:CDP-alcohol phosphatidyltransferase family protein [Mucilaginibacter galii]
MKRIPILLIYLRLVFALAIVVLALTKPNGHIACIISMMVTGLVADIFDGIIARRLGISTPRLRRLDSGVDQVFWVAIVAASYIIYPLFFHRNWVQILLLVFAEALCYGLSYVKFKKEVATHAIASKLWTLVLLATLIQVIATGDAPVMFQICFYMGIVTRLEIILMLLLIRQWTNDIPTVYHAYLIRRNKAIKRHKLFNG